MIKIIGNKADTYDAQSIVDEMLERGRLLKERGLRINPDEIEDISKEEVANKVTEAFEEKNVKECGEGYGGALRSLIRFKTPCKDMIDFERRAIIMETAIVHICMEDDICPFCGAEAMKEYNGCGDFHCLKCDKYGREDRSGENSK